MAILAEDPHNRGGQYPIKKLVGLPSDGGQWRIRWREYRLRYDISGAEVVMHSFRHRKVTSCAPHSEESLLMTMFDWVADPYPTSPYGFVPSSRFTASLTNFPSTRMPAALNLAMAFFITVPMSFIVGESISAITAFTPATISASPAALGR